MSKMKTNKERWEYLYKYVSYVNKEEAKFMKKYYDGLKRDEKVKFVKENIEKGIYLNQPPMWGNCNIFDLAKIYEDFNIKKYDFKNIDKPLVMGELYFVRLKHTPDEKFSARSVDNNNYKGLPSKNRLYKDSKVPYSNTPIRVGEMETTNLGLSGDNKPVKEMLDSYSNNPEMRQSMIEQQLTTNPFEPVIDFKDSNSNNLKIFNSLLTGIGVEIINNNGESNIKHMYNEYDSDKIDNLNKDYNYEDFIRNKLSSSDKSDRIMSTINDSEIDDEVDED